MEMEIRKYDLPDLTPLEDDNWLDYSFFCWQPEEIFLILGLSNKAEKSLIPEQVINDKIKVYKRPSGGETVILTPKTLVLSTAIKTESFADPQIYFKKINQQIIDLLADSGVENVLFKGISDICIGEKKILGSSIYRRKNKLFYHAVLNVSESVELISKYIAHPPREPEYRKGRDHKDFVTSLHQEGYMLTMENLINQFKFGIYENI